MSPRPAIFISAVSGELRSARQLVANTLTFLGYDPEWQDIFGTEEGDLRAMLSRRIDACKGVVQLVGKCYGAEPPTIDQQFGRVSYSQYEALYATNKGKKVWYLFLDEDFPTDPHEEENEEKQRLQKDYRARVKANSHLFHPLSSREGLEASVLKLRDDLTRLRRGVKRWAAFVAVLLLLSVALTIWLLESQHQANKKTSQQLQALQEKFEKLQEGVNSFAEVQNKVRQEQPGQKPDEVEQRTYEALGKELGLDPAILKKQLPLFAQELKKSPNATIFERANAAFVAKDYNEAERLALTAADEARSANPSKKAEAIKALELAAWAAEKRIEYAEALKRLRDAEQLTDPGRNAMEWARVQFAIAWVLQDQGQYHDAARVLREVLNERERALGPGHPDTLATRYRLAIALAFQGKYAEAETEFRTVIKLREKVLGSEHPDTLATRNNLAVVLQWQGKYAETETEYRAVIKLKEKALGPDHPSTLATRSNLAAVFDRQGKYAEAENEARAVLKLEEKVLGPEHPDTLSIRGNLAEFLDHQGKYTEAENEARAVIKLQEKMLGPEHPDTLETRCNLGEVLEDEGKHDEAEAEDRAVLSLREKVLPPDHPDTLRSCFNLAVCLQAEGKTEEAGIFAGRALDAARKVLGEEHPDTKKYELLQRELATMSS